MKPPCHECILICLCKHRPAIKCSLLYRWLYESQNAIGQIDTNIVLRRDYLPIWMSIEEG